MNNAWQQLFELALMDASCISKGRAHSNSLLAKFKEVIKKELKLNELEHAVSLWEEDKNEGSIHKFFRFTGNESRKFCHNFHKVRL